MKLSIFCWKGPAGGSLPAQYPIFLPAVVSKRLVSLRKEWSEAKIFRQDPQGFQTVPALRYKAEHASDLGRVAENFEITEEVKTDNLSKLLTLQAHALQLQKILCHWSCTFILLSTAVMQDLRSDFRRNTFGTS